MDVGRNQSIWRAWLLVALVGLATGCSGLGWAPVALPTPQQFETPATQISAGIRLTQEDHFDHFGAAIDFEGDVLVAGAPQWNRVTGEQHGAAYVFRRSGGEWQPIGVLLADDGEDGFQYDQRFGKAVAMEGAMIAVGAPGADDPQAGDNTGAVYLFEYDGRAWVQAGKLAPNQPTPGAQIGNSLAFDGDTLVAGGGPEADRVYVFQREAGAWREQAQVSQPAYPSGEPAAVMLDLLGDTLALSTFSFQTMDEEQAGQAQMRTGIVTVYERNGEKWPETFRATPQKAVAPFIWMESPLGIPVALGGTVGEARLLAVGRTGFPAQGFDSGSVAIFERGERGWVAQAELRLAPGKPVPGAITFFEPDPSAAFFGSAIDLQGERLAVTATFANTICVFERQGATWVYYFRITPGPEAPDDWERRTVALNGSDLLLGAPGELGDGSVFVFELGAAAIE